MGECSARCYTHTGHLSLIGPLLRFEVHSKNLKDVNTTHNTFGDFYKGQSVLEMFGYKMLIKAVMVSQTTPTS